MATRVLSTRMAIGGESEYRRALTEINSTLKTLRSELAMVNSQYKNNDKSAEALTARETVLARTLETQRTKLQQVQAGLQNAQKAQTDWAARVREAKESLAAAESELEKYRAGAGAAGKSQEEFTKRVSAYQFELERAQAGQQAAARGVNEWQQRLNYATRDLNNISAELDQTRQSMEQLGQAAKQAQVDQLTQQLEDADAALENTGARLDSVRSKLERKWDAKQFASAQQLAQRAIEQTEAKAEFLRRKLSALDDMGTDKTSAEYQKLEKQLLETEDAAERARKELQQLSNVRTDRWIKQLNAGSDQLLTLGAGLTAGVTAPLTAAGAASIKFASDTEEALNKVDVAFGASAEAVRSWSEGTLNSIGLARGTALDMAALFGDMATSMGYSREEAAQMSMELVNLAADLSSFKNIGIDQVSTALKSIFTGETESLKELGVVMTQANLEAYALAQGYTTAYTAMDQAQQVAVRYQYVLANTQNAQGDFARTSDSTANQLRIFQESLKEAAATAGEELLPVITPIIERFNGLIQSFGDLDEGTRQANVQAALFLAALGPMLTAVGGVTTAVKAGITVYQALRTALTAATAATTAQTTAQAGLNAVMAANPVGAVVTAVGTLVAVLGSLAVSTALTTERTQTLAASIDEARRAYAETRAELQDSQADTLSMVDALARLEAEENKTTAQKAAMLELVEQLNEAVPGLTLAYDAQTDSLNLTAEAIRALAEAEYARQEQEAAVERLSQAYQEQISIAGELLAAEDALQAARERYAAFDGAETRNARESVSLEAARGQLIAAQGAYDRLVEAQERNGAEIAALEEAYGSYSDSAERAAQATEEAGNAVRQTTDRLTVLTTVLNQVQGGYELLAQAQEQQSETGYLELDTVAKLLEQYPQMSGYLEEAAGGYRLADGALQDYMAAQRAEYALALNEAQRAADEIVQAETDKINAINATTLTAKEQLEALAELYQAMGANAENRAEGDGYYAIANQYWDAARAIADAATALEDFDRISASLFRESAGGGRSSGRTGAAAGAAEKIKDVGQAAMEEFQSWLDDMDHQIFLWSKDEEKTQAIADLYQTMMDRAHQVAEELRAQGYDDASDQIQELQKLWWGYAEERANLLTTAAEAESARRQEAYQEEQKDIQYFLDMGIISEEEYYTELARLRDQYLEENSDAWRQANVELHDYLERARQEELEAAQEAYEARLREMEEAYEAQTRAIEEAYDARIDALRDAQAEETEALRDRYEAEKKAAKEAYQEQVDALKTAHSEAKEAAKDRYNAEKKAAQDAYEAEKKAAQEAYEAQTKAMKEAYEARQDQINAELAAEKERLNAVLDGIDQEVQARKELREDEDQEDAIAAAQKRLEAAQAQLAFARNEEERLEWEKEVTRLQEALDEAIQDREDTRFYREKEEEKEQIQAQIDAAESAAETELEQARSDYEAELEALKTGHKAELEKMESAVEAELEQLKSNYETKLDELERTAQEELDQAKADYETKVDEMEAAYQQAAADLEARYERAEAEAKADYEQALADAQAAYERATENAKEDYDRRTSNAGGGGDGSETMDLVILEIARNEHVEYGIAKDMYKVNQANKNNPDYVPYGSKSSGADATTRAVAAAAGALEHAAQAISHTVNNVTKNNSANITYHAAGGMTEGQVARTVRKVIQELDR